MSRVRAVRLVVHRNFAALKLRSARRSCAAIVAAVLVAELLAVVVARPVNAASTRAARDVPALASAKQNEHKPEVPQGDFRLQPPLDPQDSDSRKDHTKSFDPQKSKLRSRSAKSDVYDNPDGTQTAILRTADTNWQDRTGAWHPIDATLVAEGGRWKNKSARVTVRLASTTGDGALAEVGAGDWSVSYDLEGASRGVKATVNGDKATYVGVLPDVDLEQRVLAEGVKEELVVHKQPSGAEDFVLRYPLTLRGVSAAAQADGSIAFVDPAGSKVAMVPAGVVWDADDSAGQDDALVVPLALVPNGDRGQAIELRVPRTYLADPARRYPVRVDPTVDAGHATAQWDAFGSSSSPNTTYNGVLQFMDLKYIDMVGYDVYPTSEQYTYQKFDLTPVLGKNILAAQWRDFAYSIKGSGFYRMYPVAAGWSDTTITWNNKPGHRPDYAQGIATPGSHNYMNIQSWVANWASQAWPNHGISIDTAGQNSAVRFAAAEQGTTDSAAILVTYNSVPTPGQPTAPDDGAIVMSDRPTLSGTTGSDADGTPVCYWFRVSTNKDASTGSLLNSGCLGSPTWTPPAASLVDGMTYYWRILTGDGTDWGLSSIRKFKVNLRLGAQTVSPMDEAGPVGVNLATGNLVAGLSSKSLDALGGRLGVSYTYNARSQEQFGLIGTYSSSANPAFDRLVRRDRQLDFNWGNGSPGPGIPADNFDVTWSGYLTVPYQANTWRFGAVHDDDVTVRVNGAIVYGAGCCRGANDPGWGTLVSLLAGHTVPIEVTFHEATGHSAFQLWVEGPVSPKIVPTSWLSTVPPPLPQGWSMSLDSGSGELSYTKAVVGDNSIVLVEPSGGVHEYQRQGDQSWKPVDGDDDIVTTASEGGTTVFVVQGGDGIVYTFNGKGQLLRAVTAADDRNPAAAVYEYNTTTARLQAILDPVSGKRVQLKYAFAPNGETVTTDCPKNASAGFSVEPPIGMLCQVTYWDGSSSKLYYLGDNEATRVLARIEEPGGAVTDFAYDASGRLITLRDALAADVVAAGSRPNDSSTRTEVAYDASGRVTRVTLPVPLAGDARPERTYTYASPTQTDVKAAGLLQPNVIDLVRRVTFDSSGRLTADRNVAGLVTTRVWDAEDKAVSTTDPGGLKTTTVYDHADRPVETHGPAPSACFGVAPTEPGWSGERGNGSCTAPAVPVARTAYDQGIRGLAAEYWTNKNQSGPSSLHATGVGFSGALSADWGTGSPSGLPVVDYWSARFTGDITFLAPGTYQLKLCADDGVRLFLDDEKVIDDWILTGTKCRSTSTVSSAAGSRKRIRVDYFEEHSGANIALYWTPPGVAEQLVPGGSLAPRYGLVTSTTDQDGKATKQEYALPEYGPATATVVDEGIKADDLNLRTATTYEAPGTGYFRRMSKTLPKGNTTNYAYYGAAEAAPSNDCGGVAAAGMPKSETGPTPATGSAVTRRVVYDSLHRVVGRKVDGDSRWSCTTYESRGRLATVTDSANRTTTFTYSTPGQITKSFVDSAGTARSTVEKMDLLGRTWSYADEHGTVTRRTYDQAGRAVAVYRTMPTEPEKKIVENSYNTAGQLSSSTEWLSGSPRTTAYAYDANTGTLSTTTRPNGVVTTTGYDPNRGDITSVGHTGASMAASTWTYGRSLSRRITSESTTGRTRTFSYDDAWRLTKADEGTATRQYAYDANTNRCARAADCTSPSYTYDNADRITASPEYSAYTYDDHGNLKFATPRVADGQQPLSENWEYDTAASAGAKSWPVSVTAPGTLTASADSTAAPTYYTSSTPTSGSLPASGVWTTPVPVRGVTYLRTPLTWTASSSGLATVTARYKRPDGTIAKSVTGSTGALELTYTTPSTPGTYTLEVLNTSTTQSVPSFNAPWSGTLTTEVSGATPLPAGGTATRSLAPQAQGLVSAATTWTKDTRTASSTPSGTVDIGGTESRAVTAVPGALSASLDWNPTVPTHSSGTFSGTLAAGTTWSTPLPIRGRSYVSPALNWTTSGGAASVTLVLKNPAGTVVASRLGTGGHLQLGDAPLDPAKVFGFTTADQAGTYTLEVQAGSGTTSVQWTMPWSVTTVASTPLSGSLNPGQTTASMPVTADGAGHISADISWSKGTRSVSTTSPGSVNSGSTAKLNVLANSTGTIEGSLDWAPVTNTFGRTGVVDGSTDGTRHYDEILPPVAAGNITARVTWPANSVPALTPDLALVLLDPSGAEVFRKDTSTSSNRVEELSYSATAGSGWKVRVLNKSALGSSFDLTGSYLVLANLDLELWNPAGTKVASALAGKPESLSYVVPADATGTYSFKVVSRDHPATYTINATYPQQEFASLAAYLRGPDGKDVPGTPVGASNGRLRVQHLGAAPGGTYTIMLWNTSQTVPIPEYSGSVVAPDQRTTNLDLELWSPGGAKVAESNTGSRPETLSYTVPAGGGGTYTLKAVSRDHDAAFAITESHVEEAFATVTGRLKNASGSVVAATTSSTGSLSLNHLVPEAGSYVVELLNGSTDLDADGATTTTSSPREQYGPLGLVLKDASGAVVATATGNHPAGLSAAVVPGNYTLTASPTGGAGTGTVSASVPRKNEHIIEYDSNDHAVRVDDGTNDIRETLSPDGRVLRRVVTNKITAAVVEDVLVGYDGPGDVASYSRSTVTATVTTYLGGLVYTGTTASWLLSNMHGDVVGTVDAAGVFRSTPSTDEFGVGQIGRTRLGWLGDHERFAVGGNLGLIRMGVRLYDPAASRFTSIDPVEGGCANDYVYVFGDPLTVSDLSGMGVCENRVVKISYSYLGYGGLIRDGIAIVRGRGKAKSIVMNIAEELHSNVSFKTIAALATATGSRALKLIAKAAVPASLIATVIDFACNDKSGSKGYPVGKSPHSSLEYKRWYSSTVIYDPTRRGGPGGYRKYAM